MSTCGRAGEFPQSLGLRGERHAVVGGRGEQRLDAERVTGAEQHPLLGVPDQEREHAAQPRHPVGAVVVEAGDDRLAVTLGAKCRAELLRQLGPQLQVVVDLAVEHQGVPVRVLRRSPAQRLVGVLDVDDGQPVEAEHHVAVVPGAGLVGAAVPGAHHAGRDGVDPRRRRAVEGDEPHQSAHAPATVLVVARGPPGPPCRSGPVSRSAGPPPGSGTRAGPTSPRPGAPGVPPGARPVASSNLSPDAGRRSPGLTTRVDTWWEGGHVARSRGARRLLLAGTLVAASVLLSGCSMADLPRFGWPEGVTAAGRADAVLLVRRVHRCAGRRRRDVGPDVLVLRHVPQAQGVAAVPEADQGKPAARTDLHSGAARAWSRSCSISPSPPRTTCLDKSAKADVTVDVTAFKWNWDFGYAGTQVAGG